MNKDTYMNKDLGMIYMERYIQTLRKLGQEVTRKDKHEFIGDSIYPNEGGFYITFNNDVLLTTETRILFMNNEGKIITSDIIENCSIFDPYSEEFQMVELVKIIGNGYAIHNRYHFKKHQQLGFSSNLSIGVNYKMILTYLYFVT